MKKMEFFFAFFMAFSVHAAGDYQAGQEKSTVCAACHGPNGVSINPIWPNLAGQHASYLIKQLNDIKNKKGRDAPTMAPIVAGLTEEDIADLAAFYSKQALPENSTPKKYLKRGEEIYRGGDFNRHVSACIACHGPSGRGNTQAGFPMLSGQNAAYTIDQLSAFKKHKRQNDLNAIMQDISVRMSKEDIEAVSYYVAGLH